MRNSVTISGFRLQATKIIQDLGPDDQILIRRRYHDTAVLSFPKNTEVEGATPIFSIRTLREGISSILDKVLEGEKFALHSRGKVVALLSPAHQAHQVPPISRTSYKKMTCGVAFLKLQPAQVRKLLEILEPHAEELKQFGIEMEFC